MANVLPFDELNNFKTFLQERFGAEKLSKSEEGCEDVIDELLDLYLLAYATGNNVTDGELSSDWTPSLEEVRKVIDKEVAGKTWTERVREYFENEGTVADIVRIAETDAHRIANTSALESAKKAGATKKTWVTMGDEKVRDAHVYLDGVTVGIDDDFYTYDGDHAPAPGMFLTAENNVNCRCWLHFS